MPTFFFDVPHKRHYSVSLSCLLTSFNYTLILETNLMKVSDNALLSTLNSVIDFVVHTVIVFCGIINFLFYLTNSYKKDNAAATNNLLWIIILILLY